jgi:CMP-2-keto-3-deoxyoctulosonic acid synthetase
MVQNPDAHVIAATQVKADLHPQTVVTVIDSATGESVTIIKRDPYPWIAATQAGEVRLDYGYRADQFSQAGKMLARLTLREDLLQLKALHIGATATMDSDGQMFAGVGLGYRW